MLRVVGILDHPKLLWSQRFRLTEDQLDDLLADIKRHPGAVVVIDSLRSITRSTGISENDQQMGNLVYDLKQVTTDAGGTLLLVHHGNKKNLTGQEASSGHSSIGGATNGAVSIHYKKMKTACPSLPIDVSLEKLGLAMDSTSLLASQGMVALNMSHPLMSGAANRFRKRTMPKTHSMKTTKAGGHNAAVLG